jgi:Protein of unknown function (DUF2800)
LELEGKHALLSPSSPHWVNYDEEKLLRKYTTYSAARRGTDLHALAHEAIRLRVPFAKSTDVFAKYVADGIAYKMACDQALYYSPNCFGTADCISFNRGKLRIHDLKTGVHPASMKQLEVYAALFCLEYHVDPSEIDIELRIYQRTEITVVVPSPEWIREIMERIVEFDLKIEGFRLADNEGGRIK